MTTLRGKNLHAHPDLIPVPVCRKCGAPIVSSHTATVGGIVQETWLCAGQHLTSLKWEA